MELHQVIGLICAAWTIYILIQYQIYDPYESNNKIISIQARPEVDEIQREEINTSANTFEEKCYWQGEEIPVTYN